MTFGRSLYLTMMLTSVIFDLSVGQTRGWPALSTLAGAIALSQYGERPSTSGQFAAHHAWLAGMGNNLAATAAPSVCKPNSCGLMNRRYHPTGADAGWVNL